jgi:rRNA processing protein Krr1/Pno1
MLVARRLYKDEIVEILSSSIGMRKSIKRLGEIAQFDGQQAGTRSEEGELWIEVTEDNGDLVGDPIIFAAEFAHATLVRTGVDPEEATRILSDEYAQDVLRDTYGERFVK